MSDAAQCVCKWHLGKQIHIRYKIFNLKHFDQATNTRLTFLSIVPILISAQRQNNIFVSQPKFVDYTWYKNIKKIITHP